jgi:hypothetical protein
MAEEDFSGGGVAGIGGKFTEPSALPGAYGSASIAELALGTGNGFIEFGWIVDNQGVFGDDYPHLFVALRAPNALCLIDGPEDKSNDTPCPITDYQLASTTYTPGMIVGGSSTPVLYQVTYSQGWWLVKYNGENMLKINQSFWTSHGVSFTAGTIARWFGEVYNGASVNDPCIPMGTGIYGLDSGAAKVTGMFYLRPGSSTRITAVAHISAITDYQYWTSSITTTPNTSKTFSSFAYGGPYNSLSAACQAPSPAPPLNAGGSAQVGSVSCASAGNCGAGGYYTDSSGHLQAFVVSQVSGAWGSAKPVPGTAALNAGGLAGVVSVSCGSAGNCGAGGWYTDGSGHRQVFVVSQVNGAWQNAAEIPGTAALNAGGSAQVDSVSCGSAGNCSAGGYYTDSSGGLQAFVVSQVNGGWGSAVQVPGTAALNAGGDAGVESVSCASAGNCSAGGWYKDGSGDQQAFVVKQVNGAWGSAVEVPGTAALNAGGSAGVESVSCASARNCSAGGWYKDASGNRQAFVVKQVNGGWGSAVEVPGTAALNAGGDALLISVSCASAGNCSAGGRYRDGSNGEHAFVVSQVNGTWGNALTVPAGSLVESVSCASAGNCSAGGYYGANAFVVSQVNGTWGQAVEVPGLGSLGDVASLVWSVSCASAGNCSAGGYYTDGSLDRQGFVVSQVNGTWGNGLKVPGT